MKLKNSKSVALIVVGLLLSVGVVGDASGSEKGESVEERLKGRSYEYWGVREWRRVIADSTTKADKLAVVAALGKQKEAFYRRMMLEFLADADEEVALAAEKAWENSFEEELKKGWKAEVPEGADLSTLMSWLKKTPREELVPRVKGAKRALNLMRKQEKGGRDWKAVVSTGSSVDEKLFWIQAVKEAPEGVRKEILESLIGDPVDDVWYAAEVMLERWSGTGAE